MGEIRENLARIVESIPKEVNLVAVSKTKPKEAVLEAYEAGQRIFGENKVQEMCDKFDALPKDIQWHMIGHLQSNKVKYMAPFVSLIHGVDSPKLLKEISKQAQKAEREIACLLQVHVAQEDTKFGFDAKELVDFVSNTDFEKEYPSVKISGLMAMASNVEDETQIKKEFLSVKELFDSIKKSSKQEAVEMTTLSMGMSGDYALAISCGSNMIRVGSSIFGNRNYEI